MGRDDEDARSALRLTLGRTTTEADVDALLAALPARVRAGLPRRSRRARHVASAAERAVAVGRAVASTAARRSRTARWQPTARGYGTFSSVVDWR